MLIVRVTTPLQWAWIPNRMPSPVFAQPHLMGASKPGVGWLLGPLYVLGGKVKGRWISSRQIKGSNDNVPLF
jgi:hypothetical protein